MKIMMHLKNLFFILPLFILCGCVITSKNDIIENDSATLMFGAQPNLLWVSNDGNKILLELLSGEKDRTYMAQDISDPSETTPVRFLEWPEFDLIPQEKAYIVTAQLTNNKDKTKTWYYQLLTNDSVRNIWTTWSFDPSNDKGVEVQTLAELKTALQDMIKNKHFKRRELIVFRPSSENTASDLK